VVCALPCPAPDHQLRPRRPHLTFVVTHFLPHLNRDSVWRILRAEGGAEPQAAILLGPARPKRGQTPDQVVAERLTARRKLARAKPEGRAGPEDIAKARLIAEAAREVSQLDS
jgi:hypothetical protein